MFTYTEPHFRTSLCKEQNNNRRKIKKSAEKIINETKQSCLVLGYQ